MALARAETKYVRVSPQKARLIIDLVRGKGIAEAIFQLKESNTKSGRHLLKTLLSAVANAVHNKDANRESLYISAAYINKGPTHKRAWTRSRGMRAPIERKTSHIVFEVDEMGSATDEEKK